MEKLKSYLTRKNLLLGSLINGIIALVVGLVFWILTLSAGSALGLQSAVTVLKLLCMLFYVHVILLVILTAAYAFRIFYEKDTLLSMKLLGGVTAISLLAALLSLSPVRAIHQLLNGDFMGAAVSLAGANRQVFTMCMVLLLLCGAFCAGLSGYLRFVRKSEEFDTTKAKEDLEQLGSAAKDKMSKAGAAAGEKASHLSDKWKAYYATDKGKKHVRIAAGAAGAAIVVIAGFSIYQGLKKTPIDLTSSCSVVFEGVSGEGYAYAQCSPDYDRNDDKMPFFLNTVSWEIENNGTLSNGDKVLLKAIYSEETAKGSKIKVENPEKEIEVTGLEEVYRTFAEVPTDISAKFETAAEKAVRGEIKDADNVVIDSIDLIGSYYKYSEYSHDGEAYYVYRAKTTTDSERSVDTEYTYYYAIIAPINTTDTLDLSETSSAINIRYIYLYDEEKTDAQAIEKFKKLYSNMEIIKEQLSNETYKDVEKEKDKKAAEKD